MGKGEFTEIFISCQVIYSYIKCYKGEGSIGEKRNQIMTNYYCGSNFFKNNEVDCVLGLLQVTS